MRNGSILNRLSLIVSRDVRQLTHARHYFHHIFLYYYFFCINLEFRNVSKTCRDLVQTPGCGLRRFNCEKTISKLDDEVKERRKVVP